jgi:hypothetical protein
MNLNFNFGEHFYEGYNSFWTDILVAFVGAFFGLLFALLVNRIFENREKNNEKKSKFEKDKDRIKYLGIILKSTCKIAREQIKHYSDLANDIKSTPLQASVPLQVPFYDVWRLKKMDSIELFDSYIEVFIDNENRTKEYKNIFGQGDFIFEKLNEAKMQNERHRNFRHKDELFVRDCIDEIYMRIGLRAKNFQVTYGDKVATIPEFKYLRNFENIYESISEGLADLKKFRDEYFKPLHNTILENVNEISFADNLFTTIKKALGRLQNIEYNALEFAKDMENLDNETTEAIDFLEKQLLKIEEKLGCNI